MTSSICVIVVVLWLVFVVVVVVFLLFGAFLFGTSIVCFGVIEGVLSLWGFRLFCL